MADRLPSSSLLRRPDNKQTESALRSSHDKSKSSTSNANLLQLVGHVADGAEWKDLFETGRARCSAMGYED